MPSHLKKPNLPMPDITKIDPLDLAWLSGLMEGEGCFTYSNKDAPRPRIVLSMTDEDVVDRAAKIFQSGVRLLPPTGQSKLMQYRIVFTGEVAIAWMHIFYPYMGWRRKTMISTLLSKNYRNYGLDGRRLK